jgi:outer membrane protein assembly factor BamA
VQPAARRGFLCPAADVVRPAPGATPTIVPVDCPTGPRSAVPTVLLFLLTLTLLAGCGRGAAIGSLPRQADFAGREVERVTFAGELRLPADSLGAVIVTRPPRCRVPLLPRAICPGFALDRYRLDMLELNRDVARLQLYYRDHGYYATRVVTDLDPVPPARVSVRFAIVPGDQVILRELAIRGTEGIIEPERLLRRIPLRAEEPFRRTHFLSSADTIRSELFRRGYARAEVLRNYEIDTEADFAGVEYEAIPGPLVRVDSVVVLGANRLGEPVVRRMLTFSEEDLLRATDLNNSQRNLYGLGMVSFASVEVAPPDVQASPDEDSTSTVLVRVVEAPQYMVDATAGYGTVDCFRTGLSWTNRNFLGGARRLEISGDVSRLGVGWPAGAGFESNLCSALRDDVFSDTVNYRIGADFQQPRLFGTQNRLGVGVRALRASELQTYVRRAVGGQVAVSRDLTTRTLLSTTVDIDRGATRAAPAVFCVAFDICTPDVFGELQRSRWSNSLNVNLGHDRTTTDGFAVRGWAARGGVAWASSAFGSDDEFLRLNTEVLGHRAIQPGWVLAGRLQGGAFVRGGLSPTGPFIPPDRRFYAGGPNSVRGFARNALGPIVYVAQPAPPERAEQPGPGEWGVGVAGDTLVNPRSSATGGTRIGLGTLELRTPSPVIPELMRLGFFVDGGQVWAPGVPIASLPVRFTPGMGLRFITPVGPIRVDAAYNPYDTQAGPLYLVDENDNLVRSGDFPRPGMAAGRSFWDRIQIHFAVGNAF